MRSDFAELTKSSGQPTNVDPMWAKRIGPLPLALVQYKQSYVSQMIIVLKQSDGEDCLQNDLFRFRNHF